ncbi:MAG: BrnA antitoxin family protein [Gammaproteobacteria bacterium]
MKTSSRKHQPAEAPDESTQSELAALKAKPGAEIDTSDIPAIEDFSRAVRGRFYRPVKQQVTLRLDADLLAWFKQQGGKYQTRINAVLRDYVEKQSG